MSDHQRRASLLFTTLSTAAITTAFLHWYPIPLSVAPRIQNDREDSVSVQRHFFPSHFFRSSLMMNWNLTQLTILLIVIYNHPSQSHLLTYLMKNMPLCKNQFSCYSLSRYNGVKLIRMFSLWWLFLSLIANELSYLFCEGHTGLPSSRPTLMF